MVDDRFDEPRAPGATIKRCLTAVSTYAAGPANFGVSLHQTGTAAGTSTLPLIAFEQELRTRPNALGLTCSTPQTAVDSLVTTQSGFVGWSAADIDARGVQRFRALDSIKIQDCMPSFLHRLRCAHLQKRTNDVLQIEDRGLRPFGRNAEISNP